MVTQNNSGQNLDARQLGIVTVSALTAKGDIANLKIALHTALDDALTINELKEVLVQLYAYCGFPRSLNAINALMAVVDERKAKGISDTVGRDATPIPSGDKYEAGKKTLEVLTRKPEPVVKAGAAAFVPILDTFLKEHLFADIFSRDVLGYSQRELATISALATIGGAEPQLQAHLGISLNVGITADQLKAAFSIIEKNIGQKEATTAQQILSKVIAGRKEK